MGPAGTVCGWSCDSCDPSTSGHTGGTAGKEQGQDSSLDPQI